MFAKPAGIVTVKIDPETGFLAGPDCPFAQTVTVTSGFAPIADCYVHASQYEYSDYTQSEAEISDEEPPAASDDDDEPSFESPPSFDLPPSDHHELKRRVP